MHRLFALILVGCLSPSLLAAQGLSAFSASPAKAPLPLSAFTPLSGGTDLLSLSGAQRKSGYGRGHTAKRTTLQMVGGTYFGGMAGFLAFMFSGRAFSCGCPQGESVDALERLDTSFIKIGAPTAFTLASSVAVYVIGRRVDPEEEGALLPTLGGGIAGAALGAGMVVGLHRASGDFPVGAFIASIFLPALGGTLGYRWSLPTGDGYSRSYRHNRNLSVSTRPLPREFSRRSAATFFVPILHFRI